MYDFIFECPYCKGVAFEYKKMPESDDVLKSELAHYPKKNNCPHPGTEVRCDNCDEIINTIFLKSGRISKK